MGRRGSHIDLADTVTGEQPVNAQLLRTLTGLGASPQRAHERARGSGCPAAGDGAQGPLPGLPGALCFVWALRSCAHGLAELAAEISLSPLMRTVARALKKSNEPK